MTSECEPSCQHSVNGAVCCGASTVQDMATDTVHHSVAVGVALVSVVLQVSLLLALTDRRLHTQVSQAAVACNCAVAGKAVAKR